MAKKTAWSRQESLSGGRNVIAPFPAGVQEFVASFEASGSGYAGSAADPFDDGISAAFAASAP